MRCARRLYSPLSLREHAQLSRQILHKLSDIVEQPQIKFSQRPRSRLPFNDGSAMQLRSTNNRLTPSCISVKRLPVQFLRHGARWASNASTSSSELASPEYLAHLKALYTKGPQVATKSSAEVSAITHSAWYLIVAVAFGSSNRPEAVPKVFQFVHDELLAASASIDERRLVVRRFKEVLFKSGLSCGYSRAINSLMALHYSLPEELRETGLIRKIDHEQVSDIVSRGRGLFVAHYHEDADRVQSILDDIHPDLGWFSQNIGYGHVYGMVDVVSLLETSYMLITSLITMDTPRQINWHMANCQRIGASIDDARAVRTIAMDVASRCGVTWRDGIPEVTAPGKGGDADK